MDKKNLFSLFSKIFQKKIRIYNEKNILIEEYTLFKNKLHGSYKKFYENGQLHSEKYYIHGVANGGYIQFSEEGYPILNANLDNGKFHGNFIILHKNGSIKTHGVYHEGVPQGDFKTFNSRGELFFVESFKNGDRVISFKDTSSNYL